MLRCLGGVGPRGVHAHVYGGPSVAHGQLILLGWSRSLGLPPDIFVRHIDWCETFLFKFEAFQW